MPTSYITMKIHGDLFTQASKTLDLLNTKYLKAGIRYEGIGRGRTVPVPDDALREALLNAIIHKDYASARPSRSVCTPTS